MEDNNKIRGTKIISRFNMSLASLIDEMNESFDLRQEELKQFKNHAIPSPVDEKFISFLLGEGMVPEKELIDKTYYLGYCRNARVAQWNSDSGQFIYMRLKFLNIYSEPIKHPQSDNRFDLFVPYRIVTPHRCEEIWEGDRTNYFELVREKK